jgi:coenzyme Q-binding protein COQ10
MPVFCQRKLLNCAAPELFDLVADVERYPEFLPWITSSRIRHRAGHTLIVDLADAYGPMLKQIVMIGVLHRPHRIDVTSDDRMFERFDQRWLFEPSKDGTWTEYRLDYQFRSRVLQTLMQTAVADRAAETVGAFTQRAHQLYGS